MLLVRELHYLILNLNLKMPVQLGLLAFGVPDLVLVELVPF